MQSIFAVDAIKAAQKHFIQNEQNMNLQNESGNSRKPLVENKFILIIPIIITESCKLYVEGM